MVTFEPPLIPGRLERRYKRFLADIILDSGDRVVAHCPNTGSMATCWSPGDRVFVSRSTNPRRKHAYTWEISQRSDGDWVGINTQRPNQVVAHALRTRQLAALAAYSQVRREVRWGEARLDFRLSTADRPDCLVEVKNVTLYDADANVLRFPDAVTTRGTKHLETLIAARHQGLAAAMLYVCNRQRGQAFAPATAIDPVYAQTLERAAAAGVQILAYRVRHSAECLSLDPQPLPVNDS